MSEPGGKAGNGLADNGARIALDGDDLPISTFGGMKSRGNPCGASGRLSSRGGGSATAGRSGGRIRLPGAQ